MKRVFFAEDGVTVFNVGVIDDDAEPVEGTLDVADHMFVGPGMVRVGEAFEVPAIAPAVPSSVTPRQMRLALIGAGIYDQAVAFVATQPQAVQVAWEYATTIDRADPLIAGAVAALGMSEQQADDLFRMAATL